MRDITEHLPALLAGVGRSGDVCGVGAVELPLLMLAVDGVGPIGLPIAPSQAAALAAVAEAAPYGKGPDTLVDPDVRGCGQIAPDAAHLDAERWPDLLARIVEQARAALGVADPIRADLYKLLVYAPGDFFVEHRDSEKAEGMFATLVVTLPSPHEGGALVVEHGGREVVLDLAGDLRRARWAALNADCQHRLASTAPTARGGWPTHLSRGHRSRVERLCGGDGHRRAAALRTARRPPRPGQNPQRIRGLSNRTDTFFPA